MDLRDEIKEAVAAIRTRTAAKPAVGIILGTGLGGLVKEIETETVLDYEEIPHFPLSTVESHPGRSSLLDHSLATSVPAFHRRRLRKSPRC